MSRITIIGAGMMGSAMSFPACDNGNEVRLVGTPLDREIIERGKKDRYHITLKFTLPEGVTFYQFEEVDAALDGADMVIGGVSSFGIDWFAENVMPKMKKEVPLLMITKGLKTDEKGSFIPFPVWLMDKFPDISVSAVGGPCTSYELAARWQTEVAFCGRDMAQLRSFKKILATEYYHVTPTVDLYGIETAVAMKNAYALGVSLAIGIAKKDDDNAVEQYNPQAGLFFRAAKEMDAIIKSAGGGADAIFFGAGDLYVTVFGGRTRRLGILLGKGHTFKEASEMLKGVTLESVAITRVVCGALKLRGEIDKYPLLAHIYKRICDEPTGGIPWDEFTIEY